MGMHLAKSKSTSWEVSPTARLVHALCWSSACNWLPRSPASRCLSGACVTDDCCTQVGSLTSLFPIAYGFSKFVSGVLGARTSPRIMLAGGLIATAAVNIAFGAGNSLPWFLTFWAINGILQVRRHFPHDLCWSKAQRRWSLASHSKNIGVDRKAADRER